MEREGAGPVVSRRTLFRGALATAVLGTGAVAGCGRSPAPTVASLVAQQPFYIAHRGGGGDWPEMTAYAYAQAAKIRGLQALEMSVCLTADGVLVCSHDPTTLRTTGVDLTIRDQTWATLSALQVTAAATNNPGPPARPLTRFDELAERYHDRYVLFCEPKVPEAAEPLLALLGTLRSPERVVWKQYVTSPYWARAKQAGFGTWGYLLNQASHIGAVDRWAADPAIDLLGAGIEESRGKKTIAWPIDSTADRDRALALGVAGLMTSDVAELVPVR